MDVNEKKMAIGKTMSTAGAGFGAAALFCLPKGAGTPAVSVLALLSAALFLAGTTLKWTAIR